MASTPDVRVRLSAEGVDDVVSAFKKIQQEAEKSGKGASASFDALAKSLGGLKSLLPAITFAGLAAGAVAAGKSALDYAANIGRVSERTAISVKTLSALSLALRQTGVEQDALRESVVNFQRVMLQNNQGLSNAQRAVQGLFGDRNALKGLTPDQQFLKVADALAKLGPGAKQAGLAIEFFGSRGEELLPVMNKLASEGIDGVYKEAQKLGIALDDNMVKSAEGAKIAFADMEAEIQGAALQITAGMLPALAQVTSAFTGASAGGGKAFEKLGEEVGSAVKFIAEAAHAVSQGFSEAFLKVATFAQQTGGLLDDILHGKFKGSWGRFTAGLKANFAAVDQVITAEDAKWEKSLNAPPPKPAPTAPANQNQTYLNTVAMRQQQQLIKANLAAQEAAADNALKLTQAQIAAQQSATKKGYAEGLESLQQYYADERAQAQQENDAELADLEAKLKAEQKALADAAALPAAPGVSDQQVAAFRAQFQQKIDATKAQIAALSPALKKTFDDLSAAQTKDLTAFQKQIAQFNADLASERGDQAQAAQLQLEQTIEEARLLLAKSSLSPADQAAQIAQLRAVGQANIAFQNLQTEGQVVLNNLANKRQEIDDQVASGVLFETQGQQKIIDLDKQQLPVLGQIAAALAAAAQASGNPEQVEAAKQFSEQIAQLGIASNLAAERMAQFKDAVQQSLTSDLTDFFTTGIEQAHSFGDAMRGLAASVVSSLQQIAAQMLATLAIQELLSVFGLKLPGKAAGGLIQKKAEGGFVSGPGTATSDSIPAMLSNGEFVVRAAVVREPGMLDYLRELNQSPPLALRRFGRPAFAAGGLVDLAPAPAAAAARASMSIGLDSELLLQKLEATPAFGRVVVKTLNKHRKAANAALGKGPA